MTKSSSELSQRTIPSGFDDAQRDFKVIIGKLLLKSASLKSGISVDFALRLKLWVGHSASAINERDE